MGKYDKLKQTNKDQKAAEKQQFELALMGLDELVADAESTVEVYRNASKYLENIDDQFMNSTGLDKTDITILMFATALQVGRWVVIGEINGLVSQELFESRLEHDDKSILDMEQKKRSNYKSKHAENPHVKSKHRDWANIVFDGVPYDITRGCKEFKVNMDGAHHRIRTLGHDPVLGWIFGTMNILSDTITLDDFSTFNVCMDKGFKKWTSRTTFVEGFYDAIESIKEDSNRLPAAVFAQALHYQSDILTKKGLPIPILETFAPDLAGKLYKDGYDTLCLMKDIAVVGTQAVVSVIINMLITLIHGLYYDVEKYPNRDWFEVKTRKILMWSNVIASSSNLLTVSSMEVAAYFSNNPNLAKKGWQYLDLGGYIVTMYRLTSDIKFINKVKNEFLENEWDRLVVGENFKFMSEGERNEQ
jgi:hypothetical protein